MEHHFYFITEILAALGLEHFAHDWQHVTHSWFIMILMIVGATFLARGIQMLPRQGQNLLEMTIETLEDFMVEITGPEGRTFFPFIATIFLYIFLCNLIGLVPGFFSPTADINTTLSMALCTFVLTHAIGIKFHGVKYIKHFLGPVWWLIPIVMPIEVIGHLARILSLSFRLFGNITGHELVLMILFMLAGAFFAPLPIMAMGIFVAFIQAFVFFLLSIMYFSGAMEEAH